MCLSYDKLSLKLCLKRERRLWRLCSQSHNLHDWRAGSSDDAKTEKHKMFFAFPNSFRLKFLISSPVPSSLSRVHVYIFSLSFFVALMYVCVHILRLSNCFNSRCVYLMFLINIVRSFFTSYRYSVRLSFCQTQFFCFVQGKVFGYTTVHFALEAASRKAAPGPPTGRPLHALPFPGIGVHSKRKKLKRKKSVSLLQQLVLTSLGSTAVYGRLQLKNDQINYWK